MSRSASLGFLLAVLVQTIWGALPLWSSIYSQTPALLVLVSRLAGCVLCTLVAAFVLRQSDSLISLFRSPKRWPPYLLSSALLGTNWLTFYLTVQAGRILEISMATYIMPLMTIALGIVFLKEGVTLWTGAGLALAALGVFAMSLDAAGPPWLGLIIAGAFSLYGFVRKTFPINPIVGLTFETMAMLPFIVLASVLIAGNYPAGLAEDPKHLAWLLTFGPQTALTMVLFTFAAQKLRLATLGTIQFLAPTITLAIAWLTGEALSPAKLAGFALIWSGLAFYLVATARGKATPAVETGQQA